MGDVHAHKDEEVNYAAQNSDSRKKYHSIELYLDMQVQTPTNTTAAGSWQ